MPYVADNLLIHIAMNIILKQDVDMLGSKFDVVTVKDGYARNFLIPQGLAVAATASNMKVNDEVIRQQAHKAAKAKEAATAIADKLEGLSSSSAPRPAERFWFRQLDPTRRRHPGGRLRRRAQADFSCRRHHQRTRCLRVHCETSQRRRCHGEV